MRSYLSLTKGQLMGFVVYRLGLFLTLIGNLLYIGLIYFLWQNIYKNANTIRGMTFEQAFLYLALAGSIFILFKTWVDWAISRRIINGAIIIDLIKPLDFQLQMLFNSAGMALSSLLVITLPSLIFLFLVMRSGFSIGINLAFFPIAVVLAFLISFTLDYTIGLTSFYTESLWGISMTKEIVTSILSGALIPLPFFPEVVQRILKFLPFQAIYHVPLTLVTAQDLDVIDCLELLGTQLIWVIVLFVLSRLWFRRVIRVLTVSGG